VINATLDDVQAIQPTADPVQRLEAVPGKYLTFVLADGEYAISVRKVREIIKVMPVTMVPRMAPYMKGVINLRGKVIPVVDLRLKFGLPATDTTDRTCIVVVEVLLRQQASPIGIMVDSVSDVTSVTADELEEAPDFGDQPGSGYIMALAKVKGTVKILLDLDHVLGADRDALRGAWSPGQF
jgi:purine-binding chemotaxis protein CheW